MEWKCKDCGEVFSSKNKLDSHRKISGEAKSRLSVKVCDRCGEEYIFLSHHLKECKHRYLTKEEKSKILSAAMKKSFKEGRHKGWAYTRQNPNGMSYPEQWFSSVINDRFIDKKFEYNFPFFRWKLDFAWPEKKICIEIDGRQHNEAEQKQSDLIKDKTLADNGWAVLRLPWSFICEDKENAIIVAKEFVDLGKAVDLNWKDKLLEKEILKNKERNLLLLEGKVAKDGRVNKNILSTKELEERKNKILSSGVDLQKFGWVSKVSKITGLSKHQILLIVRHFNLNVFSRQNSQAELRTP